MLKAIGNTLPLLLLLLYACQAPVRPAGGATGKGAAATTYDSLLAKRLGADDYGMHRYVMALLKAGPNREKDPEKAKQLQAAHMANINRMAAEGKLALAGPFADNGELRGIYLFNVATVEEARQLTATDPLIQSGGLVMELHPWYGSAAVQEVTAIHGRISRKKF